MPIRIAFPERITSFVRADTGNSTGMHADRQIVWLTVIAQLLTLVFSDLPH